MPATDTESHDSQMFSVAALSEFAVAALTAVGVDPDAAALTAHSLVNADQSGIASHGLLRLPLYVRAIQSGGISARPELRWVVDRDAVALLDAGSALGQVAMDCAVTHAMRNAARYGVSVVAVQNSSHYGAGAFWTERLAAKGFIAFLTSTTGPNVAPYGGIEKVLGTNPLTITAPSSDTHPLTADLATSAGAYGKVIAARNEGGTIPEGWAIDPNGRPTTDPVQAMAGAFVAFGGHKGSAVSALLEALASALGTGTYAFETEDIWTNPASRMNTGHLLIVVDVGAFTGRAFTEDRVAALQHALRASRQAGDVPVLAPGDPEYRRRAENVDQVPIAWSTARLLAELGARLGLQAPLPIQSTPRTAAI